MWAFSRRKESTIAPPARAATGNTLLSQKDELMGRCPECGGQIKLGVADRVNLLADYAEARAS